MTQNEEVAELVAKVRNYGLCKGSREQALRELRQLESDLGLEPIEI